MHASFSIELIHRIIFLVDIFLVGIFLVLDESACHIVSLLWNVSASLECKAFVKRE